MPVARQVACRTSTSQALSRSALARGRSGPGFGTVSPLATSSQLGPAKWQLGPAVGFKYDGVSVLTIAAYAQALWSVAGSDEVSTCRT